ncbi:hypothetical protein FRC12_014430 [Ceratobasidium sp. 428]|nr:hypothetical protein FRC12_014430 [Ceratobasidium sp. 428]
MPRCKSLLQRTLRGPRKFISEGPYVRDTTHRSGILFPCFYCPRILRSESARNRHILLTKSCQQADERGLSNTGENPLRTSVPDLEPANPPTTHLHKSELKAPCEDVTPPRPLSPPPEPLPPPPQLPVDNSAIRLEYDAKRRVFVEYFSDPRAGAPINDIVVQPIDLESYMTSTGNLGNPDYFETAELLMTTGLTNTGRDAHLKSRLYVGHTPWVNNKRLIVDIDKLPHGPEWKVFDVKLNVPTQHALRKQYSYLFKRSVVAAFQDLLANPDFKDYMQYAPRREWTAEDRKCRVYGETCSGNWWWDLQDDLPDKYATIVPLIISHDRTVLSVMSGGQTAYPLYLTIANIDKSVRRKLSERATTLLAYLPVDKFANVANPEEKSRLRRELIHRAMEAVFEELRTVSEEGIEVLCADGRYRKAYPIVAGVELDFEEQEQMALITKSGCPKCKHPYKGRGSGKLGPPRTNRETLCAVHAYLEDDDRTKADELLLRPVWPWWANIPHLEFSACLMPDILHQLHQGMLRHLLNWSFNAAGKAKVDRLFMVMPTAEGMRHFRQGVSGVKQWTGRESKEMAKQFLPIVACLDARPGLTWDMDFVRLARALLDFTYRGQASSMTEDHVVRLEKTLAEIHHYKKVLRRMGIFESDERYDKIVKLHMLSHWPDDIRLMGTPDGFSTETPEHMHIETKRAWRASNKVRPTPQMIKFIQRYEAIRIHRGRMNSYLGRVAEDRDKRRRSRVVYGDDEDVPFHPAWEANTASGPTSEVNVEPAIRTEVGDEEEDRFVNDEGEDDEQQHFEGRMRTATEAREHVVYPNPTLSMALKPTISRLRGVDIIAKYGATDLVSALHAYLKVHGTQQLPSNFLPTAYHEYPLWHRLYLRHKALPFDPEWPRRDVVRARPADEDQDAAFDVALILEDLDKFGLHREFLVSPSPQSPLIALASYPS